MPMGLTQINRHQRRDTNQMHLQKDWKDEMAENHMKTYETVVGIRETHCNVCCIYITRECNI